MILKEYNLVCDICNLVIFNSDSSRGMGYCIKISYKLRLDDSLIWNFFNCVCFACQKKYSNICIRDKVRKLIIKEVENG